jgi:hypothetical protein
MIFVEAMMATPRQSPCLPLLEVKGPAVNEGMISKPPDDFDVTKTELCLVF